MLKLLEIDCNPVLPIKNVYPSSISHVNFPLFADLAYILRSIHNFLLRLPMVDKNFDTEVVTKYARFSIFLLFNLLFIILLYLVYVAGKTNEKEIEITIVLRTWNS